MADRVARSHLLVEAAFFRKEADFLERPDIRLVAKQFHLARIRLHDAKGHAQTGRLACAIRAQEPDDLTVRHLQGQGVHGGEGTKPLGDGSHDQGR